MFASAFRAVELRVLRVLQPIKIKKSLAGFLTAKRPIRSCYVTMVHPKVKLANDDIIKSAEDKRSYRGLELNNGLKVLLISDPSTDKSSAAMDVHIGHMSDPDELPGLAHFCEHMLFLGTEKYPEENSYSKFLSEHGGSSNAYTSAEHTNFYFDVGPDHLNGALDRFAQFFLCPLFTVSATEREVNAVNSENLKNIMNDARRLMQFKKSTGNPNHPYSKFGTGNKETLLTKPQEKGIDTREELLKFHAKNYSANLMTLAVLGKESLDELTDIVVPLFGDVESKNLEIPSWSEHPYGPNELKLQAQIVPIKDVRSLNVTWPIPDLQPHYKSNPGHYLGHLIGHEGPGSLLSELKKRGWVNQLVGGQKHGAKGFMFFIVNVDLSEDGIEHVDDIITLIFQYLNLLKKEGPQEWVFHECQDLNAMQFRFKDKERPAGYTCNCAGALQDYPIKECLSGGYLLEEYRPDLIEMILEKLTPENIRVGVIGKKFNGQTDKKEQWYGTEYRIDPISESTFNKWRNADFHENLKLPEKNEFIPTNFDIVAREEEPSVSPVVLEDSNMVRLWYNQDNKFLLPKACINIDFTSPYAYMDPLSTNLTYMFVTLFQDALTEYSYAAELSGLTYSLHNTIYGLTLSLKGYNDKQHILLQRIMEKMTSFVIDPQRFELLKDNYIRGLKNFKAEQPHQHAVYYTSVLMSEQLWIKDELLDAIDEVTVERLRQFIPQLLSRMYMEMLIYGNVTRERARQLADVVTNTLTTASKTKSLLPSQQRRYREIQMPDGCYYLYKKQNEFHRSSSLEVYYQCNMQETHTNMLLELFCQIISEPCFDILRTQEQLGYIVFSGCRRANGVQGLRVIVQSDKSPEYVENRIEAFLHKMEEHIQEMSEEVFDNHVKALATKRMEKPKKLTSQNAKFWSEIISQQYNFDRDNIEVAHLSTLKKDDVLKFYKELLSHDAPKRHKLCVHISSAMPDQEKAADNTSDTIDGLAVPPPQSCEATVVNDVSAFKRELGLFPLPKPYIQINSAMSKL